MSDIEAFVSDDAQVIATFDEGLAEWNAWSKRMHEQESRYGRKFLIRSSFKGGKEVVGIANGEIPDGWVKLKRNNYLTPNKRTKAGKEVQRWLDPLQGPDMM